MESTPTERLDLELVSLLGERVRLESVVVEAGLSRCFELRLQLLSEVPDIPLEELLGQPVLVRVERPEGGSREFHGYVESFAFLGEGEKWLRYEARVVPWLWFLTQSTDCRIFQNESVPEIVKAVFRDLGFHDFEERLNDVCSQREYCVQYRESDYDFVTRLLHEEGIFFYFRHESDKHVLVLADNSVTQPGPAGLDYVMFRGAEDSTSFRESAWEWVPRQRIRPGVVSLNDYDELRPRSSLRARVSSDRGRVGSEYELYDYPGRYRDLEVGERRARSKIEAIRAGYEVFEGLTDVLAVQEGLSMRLAFHPRADLNRDYLVTSVKIRARDTRYDLEAEGTSPGGDRPAYLCEVSAIDLTTVFRPPSGPAAPLVHGPQTATVVGPAGEEVFTDSHGRVKVQFHWDREGGFDENSSCWIRVAQTWAGRNWGAAFLPRVGDEVVVEFIEGDPDRPLIVGSVYNGANTPPLSYPEQKLVSGVKSCSSKEGVGYNEIQLDDRKGSERFAVRAERDHSTWVGNDSTTRVERDRYVDVQNDQSLFVGRNCTVQVEGESNHSAKKEIRIIGDRTVTVVAASELKLQTGDSTVFLKSDGTIIIAGKNIVISGSEQFAYAADTIVGDAGSEHHFKGATVKHNV